MKLGILAVILVFAWEINRPIPDFDRLQFDEFKEKTKVLAQPDIPQSVLIYYKIESVHALKNMKKPLNPTEFKSWVNFVTHKEKLIKFEVWLKQTNE
jgi:hypothetical protein